jgi:membrane protease subunit HflC
MKPQKWAILGVVVVGLGLAASGSFFTVEQTKQAIVLQFGEPKRVIKKPGLAFKFPLIQDVLFYDNRILDLDPPSVDVLLTNKKRIVVDAYMRYVIIDPLAFYRRVGTETVLRDRLSTIINSGLRQVLATVSLADVLSTKRDDIMNLIEAVGSKLSEAYGIQVVDIRLVRTNLPADTRQAVFDRMRSEREREARELRAEGREEALGIRAKADYEKTVLLAEAERKALILRGEGESGRNRILGNAYSQDPAFFDFYKSLSLYREHLVGDGTTIVMSPDSEFFRYFDSDGVPAITGHSKDTAGRG